MANLVTFLLLHHATRIQRELKIFKKSHLIHQYLVSSNERPFEYLRKLFQVCSEAQNPDTMSEAHIRAQKFFSDQEIIRRTSEPNSYFRLIPTEGLRKILPEEKDFSIAFVHLIHDNVGIFEMFLAVMYRPQNFHCIHIDSKVYCSFAIQFLNRVWFHEFFF